MHPFTSAIRSRALLAACGLGLALFVHLPAQAQLDKLKEAVGGSGGSAGAASSALGGLGGSTGAGAASGAGAMGALGGLSGVSMPSLEKVGTGNLTGVLGYCAKNQLGGAGVAGVKDQLMGKLGGEQKAKADPGYQEGLSGVLGGNSGSKLDLGGLGGSGGSDMKSKVTDQVCGKVLEYGQKLL